MAESKTVLDSKHCFEYKVLNHIPVIAIDVASRMNRFVGELHEALDLQRLFDTFSSKFREAVSYDGIEYKDDSTSTCLLDGIAGKHHCVYELKYETQSLGSISISRDSVFLKHEIEIIEVMLAGLTLPLRNALSYKEAISKSQRDQLTGLRNGAYYQDVVELEINRAQRYSSPFSLLMFDIDNLNDINQQYGRRSGDAVIVEVARRIESESRNSDTVYSGGADQFLVLLPGTVKPQAMGVATRMKQLILGEQCVVENNTIPFTVSAGVATVAPDDTAKQLMTRVNEALLQAKTLGKNRVYGALQINNIHAG